MFELKDKFYQITIIEQVGILLIFLFLSVSHSVLSMKKTWEAIGVLLLY